MLIKFTVSILPLLFLIALKSKKSLQMLQQNYYDDDHRYLKWILKNPYKVFLDIDIWFLIFCCGFALDINMLMFLFFLFYLIISSLQFVKGRKGQQKLPLKYTSRVKRLCFTIALVYLIVLLTLGITIEPNSYFLTYAYLILGCLTYFNYFVVMFANICNIPVEHQVKLYYKRKAIQKIKNMNHLSVIGITGSYGKTSSKNILSDILNVKFNALPTPKSFNTPNGLILTINNYLDKFNDLFIAEMGAFKRGEIKELCDLVYPKYGILTRIGTAHLESFGGQENIQKGKFELIESLPKDGIAILNRDDEYQVSYSLKNPVKVIWIGIHASNCDVCAENIELSCEGTKFDVVFCKEKKSYPFETKLLGEANVYNLLAGIALGYELGMSVEQLQTGVKQVKVIEHRLELKKYGNINIIDDAYNSNPVGSKMALEVLGMMPGKKIVVTPGMIELGPLQDDYNLKFGEYIANNADEVILVGVEQTKSIYKGLQNQGFDEKKIHVINDVKLAFPLMQQLKDGETYVLLENDLPDLFNE